MRRKHLSTRFIPRTRADRYIKRFGGQIFKDSLNGYTLLLDGYRRPLAFVR